MSRRLGKQQWINAGLRAVVKKGVEAVRIEPLAEALSVTKGSFYWHFKDRGALLDALLETWEARATSAVIDQVEGRGGDARAKLRSLFSIVGQVDGRLDRAIRAWAAVDETARKALERVDSRRLDYLQTLFLGVGFSPEEALARARLVYHALIGQFMMATAVGSEDRLTESINIVLPMLISKD